jgi:catechol 2,3-dioxygenase-like lactoylglutathione lyase family enzyme
MDWTLELVVIPVADVDRAKAFYVDQLGFVLDVDMTTGPEFRVVQLTPPGSACSIAIGVGLSETPPGTLHGVQLCVDDVEVAHRQLVEHGVDVSEPFFFGEAGRTSGLDPERRGYASFVSFHDVDGNTWLVQEVKRDWVLRQVKRDEIAG